MEHLHDHTHDTASYHTEHTMHHTDGMGSYSGTEGIDSPFDNQGNLIMIKSSNSTDEKSPFCKATMHGGGMIMYMDGFHFSLKGNHTCLNLLLPTWTLDSSPKFCGAIVAVFFAAFFLEGFSKLRHKIARAAKKSRRGNGICCSREALRGAVTVLHGLQALFGYGLMLITMTFSLELLFATCFGLSVGYYVWFMRNPSDEEGAEDANHHVTSNPCCEFMEEECRELPGTPSDDGNFGDNSRDLLASPHSNESLQQRRRWRNGEEVSATELVEPLVGPHSSV